MLLRQTDSTFLILMDMLLQAAESGEMQNRYIDFCGVRSVRRNLTGKGISLCGFLMKIVLCTAPMCGDLQDILLQR